MSFDDVNQAIRSGGGSFAKLSVQGQVLEGNLLDCKVQEKIFEGKKVPNATTGQPRIEWLFSIETADGIKKFSAMEGAQSAVRTAMAEAGVEKMEMNGRIRIELTQEYKRNVQFAEYKVTYTPPKFQTLPDDDEAPF
jgi:hypothetical protein